jgi:hypothetical protein
MLFNALAEVIMAIGLIYLPTLGKLIPAQV